MHKNLDVSDIVKVKINVFKEIFVGNMLTFTSSLDPTLPNGFLCKTKDDTPVAAQNSTIRK
jgi:hypothetical protein